MNLSAASKYSGAGVHYARLAWIAQNVMKPALLVLHGTAAVLGLCLLCSCATTPPKYEYSDTGLTLTSQPTSARVEITVQAVRRQNGIEIGRRGLNQVSFLTPHFDAQDKFIRHGTLPDNTDIQFKYTVKVSRAGYGPIIQEIDGRDIKSDFHWVLEPVDPQRLAAASNAPAAWVRLESCLLNGRPIPENYFRFQEIRHYLAEFVTALIESNLFVTASTERSELHSNQIVEFRLDFREKENRGNPAAAAGQAMVSGFFTLGVAPIAGKFAYESEVNVNVVRWDGQTRHYTSQSKFTSRWLERPDGSQHAQKLQESAPATRNRVTAENLMFLISKAAQDADFYLGSRAN